jgi:hypothetical protein
MPNPPENPRAEAQSRQNVAPAAQGPAGRIAKEASALRANLRRRKVQAAARKVVGPDLPDQGKGREKCP